MLWRIRPIEVKVRLFLPPRGKTWPGVYSVWADADSIGWLDKHADTPTKKHPWRATKGINDVKSLGTSFCLDHAVEALLKAKKKAHCPFTVKYDPGSVNGRPYDFGRAYSIGDDEDRIHFLVQKNPADGKFYVDCVIASKTIGCDLDLEVRGPFKTYREAGEAGLKIALDWLPHRGVPVDADEVEAIRKDFRTHTKQE
jgi:hypothetical protein